MNSKMIKTSSGLPEFPVDALVMRPWSLLYGEPHFGIWLESYESLLEALIITSFLEGLKQQVQLFNFI